MIKNLSLISKSFIFFFLVNLLFVWVNYCFSKQEADSGLSGEKLFKANCAGCHINGQNLIKPDKPIVGSAKLKSKQSFKAFIESPPPPMPNFRNITEKPKQFEALYSYVITLKGK